MVCLAINNDCGGANFCKNVQVSSILSTSELESENIVIYPNPATNRLQLKGIKSGTHYRIIDLTGKTVDAGSMVNSFGLDISSLYEGIYLLDLQSENEKAVKKFQVIK